MLNQNSRSSTLERGSEGYLARFYEGVELEGKSMLEIGCGSGVFSIYAHEHGAKRIVALEPLADGSSAMPCSEVSLYPRLELLICKFGDYDSAEQFDLIVLHDVINHLNERACIELRRSGAARYEYYAMFRKMYRLLKDGGKIVIADASPRNLFADLHLPNLFDRSIEWYKHQIPEVWVEMMDRCGFRNPELDWLAPCRLMPMRWLVSNWLVSYCLVSHFRLVMEKPNVV